MRQSHRAHTTLCTSISLVPNSGDATSAENEVNPSEGDSSQSEDDRDKEIAYREHVFAFKSFEKVYGYIH